MGTGGVDTCRGDSGGPLMELIGDGVGERRVCRWRVVGVTSRPVASARVVCGHGGIYTRVDRVRPWIDEQLRRWSTEES